MYCRRYIDDAVTPAPALQLPVHHSINQQRNLASRFSFLLYVVELLLFRTMAVVRVLQRETLRMAQPARMLPISSETIVCFSRSSFLGHTRLDFADVRDKGHQGVAATFLRSFGAGFVRHKSASTLVRSREFDKVRELQFELRLQAQKAEQQEELMRERLARREAEAEVAKAEAEAKVVEAESKMRCQDLLYDLKQSKANLAWIHGQLNMRGLLGALPRERPFPVCLQRTAHDHSVSTARCRDVG